jgi:hypothetical protein
VIAPGFGAYPRGRPTGRRIDAAPDLSVPRFAAMSVTRREASEPVDRWSFSVRFMGAAGSMGLAMESFAGP